MRAEEHLKLTEELERQAARTRSSQLREEYLKLAKGWRRLAASVAGR